MLKITTRDLFCTVSSSQFLLQSNMDKDIEDFAFIYFSILHSIHSINFPCVDVQKQFERVLEVKGEI